MLLFCVWLVVRCRELGWGHFAVTQGERGLDAVDRELEHALANVVVSDVCSARIQRLFDCVGHEVWSHTLTPGEHDRLTDGRIEMVWPACHRESPPFWYSAEYRRAPRQ